MPWLEVKPLDHFGLSNTRYLWLHPLGSVSWSHNTFDLVSVTCWESSDPYLKLLRGCPSGFLCYTHDLVVTALGPCYL
jgi:hypothetical protein